MIGLLQSFSDRSVIDRTELTGLFDFLINWPALAGVTVLSSRLACAINCRRSWRSDSADTSRFRERAPPGGAR